MVGTGGDIRSNCINEMIREFLGRGEEILGGSWGGAES